FGVNGDGHCLILLLSHMASARRKTAGGELPPEHIPAPVARYCCLHFAPVHVSAGGFPKVSPRSLPLPDLPLAAARTAPDLPRISDASQAAGFFPEQLHIDPRFACLSTSCVIEMRSVIGTAQG